MVTVILVGLLAAALLAGAVRVACGVIAGAYHVIHGDLEPDDDSCDLDT